MDETIVDKLDDLVVNNDILPVRVSVQHMTDGKKDTPTNCPGVLAIAAELGRPDMVGIRIQVGHRTKEHLSNRVVVKIDEEPSYKWIGWILNSPGKSGFHPEKFDKGKQKNPGAMVIERWSKLVMYKMPEEKRILLHSKEYREKHLKYLEGVVENGIHRIYNGSEK